MTPTTPTETIARADRVLTEYVRLLTDEYVENPSREARVEAMARALTAPSEGFSDTERWLPIESAPKDQVILIVGGTWSSDNYQDLAQKTATIAYWCGDHWRGDDLQAHDDWKRHKPTHWQPLPAPPALSAESGGDGDGR